MLEADPSLTPAQIRDIISRTATPLPKYFYHEAGAGMLNTHAAVLEAAFPERHMGDFRSILSRNPVRFVTRTLQTFDHLVTPGSTANTTAALPANTVQATVNISWGTSTNDFGLKVFGSGNSLLGESNQLNLPVITGRREKVSFRNPGGQNLQAAIRHTANTGTQQRVFGAIEVTQVDYPALNDLGGLPQSVSSEAETALIANLLLPAGSKFRPYWSVSRSEFAEAMVRAGLVPQYIASSPMFLDVRDRYTRNAVEGIQSNPGGSLFTDAAAGQRFYPYSPTSRLAAAIALVKAAKLEHLVSSTALPAGVADAASIPQAWRGHVAVALSQGFISLDANRFEPQRSITRLELAVALNRIVNR
jgi:serine protease AprX